MLIFQRSRPGRRAAAQAPREAEGDPGPCEDLPAHLRRRRPLGLPEVSEGEVVRHYTGLSRLNYSVDTHFYPLGSCTMKHNPRACHELAMLEPFRERHPLAPAATGQGLLACLWELQELLAAVTGMEAVSLAPMAGAQGEFAGVAMIRAYHRERGEAGRDEILVPDAAHGTNPASAAMAGFRVREVPTGPDGDVDLQALEAALGPRTAGIMLTNPSTLGVFERRIQDIARLVHGAGGLLYYDGANLNAVLGKVRPADMGFDVVHLNLHKTFATPHGGGGPGAGPVACTARLAPYLPVPRVVREGDGRYRWLEAAEAPRSIGRLGAFAGNVGVLLRAYVYLRVLGEEGLPRVAEHATLAANYLQALLRRAGYRPAFPQRRATHEFALSLQELKARTGVSALDVAKALLDRGFYAPTVYFPALVPECLLIEPTETESRETLEAFAAAMADIRREAEEDPERLRTAPHGLPVGRLDEVRAARRPDLAWPGGEGQAR
ncbi:MAG: glycine dehydrogenase subunit 2, partial [Gammaproteobacteria bacterium]